MALVPLTPRLGATDSVITHYFALGIVGFYGLSLNFIKNSKFQFKFNHFTAPILFYTGFFLIAVASYFFAINQVESLIALAKLVLIIIHLYIIYSLELYKLISEKHLLWIITLLLFIESVFSIYPVIEIVTVTDYKLEFANDYLKGFAGNKNITAASLVMKLPFVFILYSQVKNNLLKYLLIIISILVLTNLLFLGSRASFISLFIIFTSYLSYLILTYSSKLNFDFFRKIFFLPFIIIVAYFIFNNNVATDDQGTINNRISSVALSELDESSSQRLRFYEQAIRYSIENPFMGAGIGNWKIISISLDREYITSYIVPYVLHNDFLEVLGETNFIGFLFYVMFYISILYLVFKGYRNSSDVNVKSKFLLIGLVFFSFIIDSMLNFPMYRALMQVSLLLSILFLLVSYHKAVIDNE